MQNSNNSEQKDEEIASDEGQYVQNAGLVLIHPFMKTFLSIAIFWTRKLISFQILNWVHIYSIILLPEE